MICVDKNQLIMPQNVTDFVTRSDFLQINKAQQPDLMERNGCHFLIQQCKKTLNQL